MRMKSETVLFTLSKMTAIYPRRVLYELARGQRKGNIIYLHVIKSKITIFTKNIGNINTKPRKFKI